MNQCVTSNYETDFRNLNIGEMFIYKEGMYMKVDIPNLVSYSCGKAVNLETGIVDDFSYLATVTRVICAKLRAMI